MKQLRRCNFCQRRGWRVGCGILLLGLTVRSLPYLAPIRAGNLVQDQRAIEFRDRNGLPLGTVLSRDQSHTAVVPLAQVSPHFIQAILAAEDSLFYRHGPLEMRAIARAVLEAAQAGHVVSGASTVTMQLSRMLDPGPRTLADKGQEVWLSWRLAAGMSKDEILQAYVNRLPMGGNLYGVEAAARVYFGVPAADLNLAQASLLAGLPNDPNRLNPYDNLPALKRRQRYVLDRMVQDGYITETQRDRVFAEAVSLRSRQQGIIAAPHFLFWLAGQLPDHPAQVRTTIDRPLQQFAEAQVQQVIRALGPHNVHHAAVLVLDNASGEVLAYVGSPDYFAESKLGRNDGVQALRQPGSTLKPFLYQLAIENRVIRPNTVLADVPTYYAIPGARLYRPIDYSETFQGPVRVRVALANSLNVPAVRVLEKVGVAAFLNRLHQLGFRHLTQSPEHYGLGLTLGSGEVSLWELAQAYLTVARQGQAIPLVAQLRSPVTSTPLHSCSKALQPFLHNNTTLVNSDSCPPLSGMPARAINWGSRGAKTVVSQTDQLDAASKAIGSATTWALITNMLSDRHARAKAFGVESVLSLPFPAAVKTGTSSDFRDTWTVGFTSDYTVATWVGNFNGDPMRQISGVTGAAPLWQRVMLHLHEHREPAAFSVPPGLVQRPVCALSGLKPTAACPSVVQEYFYPEDLGEYDRHLDTFYQATNSSSQKSGQYRLNLPAEYDEWLAQQPLDSAASGLKILSPREGDYFLLDPSQKNSQSPQRLQFKLAAPADQPVEWWLNGQKLAASGANSIAWTLEPGNWTLQVKTKDAIDQVSFEVGVAEAKANRRGFSIAQPQ